MRNAKCILAFIGLAILPIGSLRADSFQVSAFASGPFAGDSCQGTTYCKVLAPGGNGLFSEASVSETISYNQISVQGMIDPVPEVDPNDYGSGEIKGTITLPSTWTKLILTVDSSGPGSLLYPLFDEVPGQCTSSSLLPPSHASETCVLDPSQTNQIRFDDQGYSVPNGPIQTFSITASDPDAPAPTPEPASAALVMLPLVVAGVARWRKTKAVQ